MSKKFLKVSLVALGLLLLFSFCFAWDPPYRNTGHTWDERGGSTSYKGNSRDIQQRYFIVLFSPFDWGVFDLGKIEVKKSSNQKADQIRNSAQ